MHIMVTGGAGFIGSTFVHRRLSSTADSVVVLDRLTYAGSRDNLVDLGAGTDASRRLRLVEGDICDRALVGELVIEADAVVNLAAESHVDRSILDSEPAVRTNIVGVDVLLGALRAAREADGRSRRFLQVSTDEVYGPCDDGERTETDPLDPRSPYAATKAAAELLALAAHATFDLDVVVTRGANTYGPRQYPEKLVPLFVTNALLGWPLPIYGDGLQRRDWLHVDDHADAIGAVLDQGRSGMVYNVPARQERSNRDVTRAILETVARDWDDLVRGVDDRAGHDVRYAMDGTRVAALGWTPRVAFDDGLRRTVEWYRDHADWWHARRNADWERYYERQYAGRLAGATAT